MFARLFDSPLHLVILVLIIVVVFGWKRLPDAARSLGRSARILKSEVGDMAKDSDASKQTVKGETGDTAKTGSTQAGAQRVPGEAPTAAPGDASAQQKPGTQQPPQYQPPQNGQNS